MERRKKRLMATPELPPPCPLFDLLGMLLLPEVLLCSDCVLYSNCVRLLFFESPP